MVLNSFVVLIVFVMAWVGALGGGDILPRWDINGWVILIYLLMTVRVLAVECKYCRFVFWFYHLVR